MIAHAIVGQLPRQSLAIVLRKGQSGLVHAAHVVNTFNPVGFSFCLAQFWQQHGGKAKNHRPDDHGYHQAPDCQTRTLEPVNRILDLHQGYDAENETDAVEQRRNAMMNEATARPEVLGSVGMP